MSLDFLKEMREPLFLMRGVNPHTVYQTILDEGHRCVFVEIEGTIYVINSFELVLGLQTWTDHGFSESWFVSIGKPIEVIPRADLKIRAVDMFAEEVILTEHDAKLMYLTREDFLLSMMEHGENGETSWLHSLFSSIPRGLMIIDLDYAILNSNAEALRMLKIATGDHLLSADELFGREPFRHVLATQSALLNQLITLPITQATLLIDFVPLIENHVMNGYALVIQDLPSVENMAMELGSVKGLNEDLQAILSTIYDEIIVVDAKGTLLRASSHYLSNHWDIPPHQLIGQKISSINTTNSLLQQIILKVQKTKNKISLMQNTEHRPLLSVGNPIITADGKLDRIVIASRDLTEVTQLRKELDFTRKQSESYKKRLEKIQEQSAHLQGTLPVFSSPKMLEIVKEVEQVAQFSSSILLYGESGVGKEVIANMIHSLSSRRNFPLIKINCASIPENLLESELFGYVKGAFSGARTEGKMGLFLKADKGILFLDEISELPYPLQSKLLRAIQEREVYPVGATEPIRFDVQFIFATNHSLVELVQKGQFREDLYYRISVFPIEIPPLRERSEDIPVLANQILFEFNKTYNRNLRFSGAAIEVLEAYSFPGNVRELQNIVQRIAIKNDGDMIEPQVVEMTIMNNKQLRVQSDGIFFKDIIPLKKALEQVEETLIRKAMEKYGSTTKAAKALGISQSSVSRKFQRLL